MFKQSAASGTYVAGLSEVLAGVGLAAFLSVPVDLTVIVDIGVTFVVPGVTDLATIRVTIFSVRLLLAVEDVLVAELIPATSVFGIGENATGENIFCLVSRSPIR